MRTFAGLGANRNLNPNLPNLGARAA